MFLTTRKYITIKINDHKYRALTLSDCENKFPFSPLRKILKINELFFLSNFVMKPKM